MSTNLSNTAYKSGSAADFKHQFLTSLEKEAQTIPPDHLKPMVEARNLAPKLFKDECDPFTFCCRDDGDDAESMAKATARRLVDYWHHRSALFGDRKYLPLDQTGKGALTQQDVALLQTGFVAPLFFGRQQGSSNSNNNTVVLCFNRSRLLMSKEESDKEAPKQYFTAQSKLRCIFYILVLLCQQTARPSAAGQQQHQQAAAAACRIRILMPNAQSNLSHAIIRFAACFPIRIESIHLVCMAGGAAAEQQQSSSSSLESISSSGSSLHELLPAFVVQQQQPKRSGTLSAAAAAAAATRDDDDDGKAKKRAPILHLAANAPDAATQLQSHGFTLEVIPQELGGDWSYDQFDAWLMKHRQREVGKMLNEIAAQSLGALGDLAAQEMGSEEENKNKNGAGEISGEPPARK